MDFLSWVRGILVVALFGWLLEALQPADSMRRYTRLAIGLLLMVAILRPAVGLLHGSVPRLAAPYWSDPDVQGLLQQGVFLQQKEEAQAVSAYRTQLAKAASAAAQSVVGGPPVRSEVAIDSQDAPQTATVHIGGSARKGEAQAVQAAVAQTLGISPQAVRVEWDEGG